MHSAGDLEKYGYCPVSWWLSRQEDIWNEDTERGVLHHDKAAQGYHEAIGEREKEREMLISLFISTLVFLNAALIFLIFIPSTTPEAKRLLFFAFGFFWVLLSCFMLAHVLRRRHEISDKFHDAVMAVLGVVILLYSFNILGIMLMGSVSEWVYGFLALFWLALSLLVGFLSFRQRCRTRNVVGRMGLDGDVVYVGEESSPLMVRGDIGLCGRPDLVLLKDGIYVPLELKTGRTPRGPFFSHVLQIGAYCLLASEHFGPRVEVGILRYPGQDFEIEFDESLEQLVKLKLQEMDAALGGGEPRRNHQRRGKCQNCSRLEACSQAIR